MVICEPFSLVPMTAFGFSVEKFIDLTPLFSSPSVTSFPEKSFAITAASFVATFDVPTAPPIMPEKIAFAAALTVFCCSPENFCVIKL